MNVTCSRRRLPLKLYFIAGVALSTIGYNCINIINALRTSQKKSEQSSISITVNNTTINNKPESKPSSEIQLGSYLPPSLEETIRNFRHYQNNNHYATSNKQGELDFILAERIINQTPEKLLYPEPDPKKQQESINELPIIPGDFPAIFRPCPELVLRNDFETVYKHLEHCPLNTFYTQYRRGQIILTCNNRFIPAARFKDIYGTEFILIKQKGGQWNFFASIPEMRQRSTQIIGKEGPEIEILYNEVTK